MDNMGQTVLSVLYLDQKLLEIVANFNIDPIICDFDKDLSKFAEWLNGQYG